MLLTEMQQLGRTLTDVVTELSVQAGTDAEAALLLRDLTEVLNMAEYRISEDVSERKRRGTSMIRSIMNQPFDGEAVLF